MGFLFILMFTTFILLSYFVKQIQNTLSPNNYINIIFSNALKNAQKKNWDKIYLAVNIHDTIVRGNYIENVLPTEFIGNAKVVLQYISKRKDIEMILYTCSHPDEIKKYLQFFKKHDIHFKYVNENLDIPNNALGCYDKKLYFNVLLDDKSGFIAEKHWDDIYTFIRNVNFNCSK